MIDRMQRVVAWLMNRVRVNQVQQAVHDGVPVFVKRRRLGAGIVVWFANRFLSLARSGCCMFVRTAEWMDWEVYCARLLYPERPAVRTGPGPSVTVPAVPGVSLRDLLRRNEADLNAFIAAARELKRVHQLPCGRYKDGWSHGDLHLDNILYDRDSDQAVLIDFDTRHDFALGRLSRQADDLKVMILELVGMVEEHWRPPVTALIEEYRQPDVLRELARQLFMPCGLARILWHTRLYGGRTGQVEQRLELVRAIVERVATAGATPARPAATDGR